MQRCRPTVRATNTFLKFYNDTLVMHSITWQKSLQTLLDGQSQEVELRARFSNGQLHQLLSSPSKAANWLSTRRDEKPWCQEQKKVPIYFMSHLGPSCICGGIYSCSILGVEIKIQMKWTHLLFAIISSCRNTIPQWQNDKHDIVLCNYWKMSYILPHSGSLLCICLGIVRLLLWSYYLLLFR